MNEMILARRYARAFLTIYPACSLEHREELEAFKSYLREHKKTLFYLKLSLIPANIKLQILERATERFELKPLNRLLFLLAEHRRLHLLPEVLEALIRECKVRCNIEEFTVSAPQHISERERQDIATILGVLTHKKIELHLAEEPRLIAGIKAQSETHKWEYSVRQLLNAARNRL